MREFIIRDWKQGDSASDSEETSGEEGGARAEAPARREAPEPRVFNAPARRGEMEPLAETPPMPELRAEGLAGQVRVTQIPAKRASTPSSRAAQRPAGGAPARPRKRGERSFIISYDGVFVGFFEAENEVTPREAFMRVAQEMASDEGFVPEKLEIYKPVLIKSAKPSKAINVVRGKLAKLSWQAKGTGVVQASPAPETAEPESP